jgi:hypothetical protein
MDTKFKNCNTCKKDKSFDDYYHDKRKSDGLYQRCKTCHSEYQQKRIQRDIENGLRPPKKYSPMTEKIKCQILKLYSEGIGAHTIAKEVDYSKASILRFLTRNNHVRKNASYRKYKLKDEHYFDCINTDDKAYFLGLLWADGCNYRKVEKHKNAHQIVINLQEEDGYILNEMANRIFINSDIVSYKIKKSSKQFENRCPQYSLRIPSRYISDTLFNYGMIPRKSFDIGMPINIDWTDITLRAFIRGFLDGDGSIYQNANSKHYGVSFISSVKHINEMNNIIEHEFGKKMSVEIKTNYSQPMAVCKFHGNQITKHFLDWLYKDSTIHLNRKYDKYLILKDIVESKVIIKDGQLDYHQKNSNIPQVLEAH